jgi:hypothetical protein
MDCLRYLVLTGPGIWITEPVDEADVHSQRAAQARGKTKTGY